MSLTNVKGPTITLTGHLLDSISEVMSLVEVTYIEHEIFMELGCYLYRISPIIMELHTTANLAKKMTEILSSLSANVDHAKQQIKTLSNGAISEMSSELKTISEQLESTIYSIGSDLSLIPSSAFKNSFTELVIQSLSRDMRNACIQINGDQSYGMAEPEQENLLNIKPKSQRKRSSSYSSDKPRLVDFLKGMYYRSEENEIQSFATLKNLAEYIEPLYDTFFCPLTKKIMEDPVTIESGVTYERNAINEWFEKHYDDAKTAVCPTTGLKLHSRVLSTNLALKTTIREWTERNEATRLRVAHTALSLALSEEMVIDAIRDLLVLRQKGFKSEHMHIIGITELLPTFLEHGDRTVRCETLSLLKSLAEDDKGKEIIMKTEAIATTVKMLSSYNSSERHASVSLLLELTKSEITCETIGEFIGSIFMLITMKNNKSDDPLIAEEAGDTLKNLEKCPKNIKCMAENGFLQPLLNHLIEGTEDIQVVMADYLNELVLKSDIQTYVTEKISTNLIEKVQDSNNLNRKAALKALVLVSSYEPNIKTLIDAGIIPFVTEKMFTWKICHEPTNVVEDFAIILVSIFCSGVDPESIQVNKHGNTMASEYFIRNIIGMLNNSMPYELNINLIRVLVYLSNIQKPFSRLVSVIKETKAIQTVTEFLNSQNDELAIASTELLIKLATDIGHAIAEELCKTQGQPEALIGRLDSNQIHINKKNAIYLNLLAKLPHQNLALNLALLDTGTVPTILDRINRIQRGETMASSWTRVYLEGLVGTLVRFTSTIDETDILQMARQQNLSSVLTGLVQINAGSEEVQRLAAMGLEKLSSESINLTIRHHEIPKPRKKRENCIFICFGVNQKVGGYGRVEVQVCQVHKGECSPNTFCLLEAKAVQGLVSCLESENDGIVEAALGAISTLLDERVDLERSVRVLCSVDAVKKVMGVLRERQEGRVLEKALWMIERFLDGGDEQSVTEISRERVLPKALAAAFHNRDGRMRTIAERITRKLSQRPPSQQAYSVK